MRSLIVPILGISTVVTFSILLLLWELRCRHHIHGLDELEPRIIVTGTRGKSSTVRLVHAVLREGGRRPWGRVTGTVTEEISPEGRQILLSRKGQTSIIEFLATISRARREASDCLITESMAVKPELIALSQQTFVRADICVITNVRADHMEDEGLDLLEIARSLAAIATGARLVITADRDPEIVAVLRDWATSSGARFLAVHGDLVDPGVLATLPGEFADNVAIALAIADELDVDLGSAVAGMSGATHEPFAHEPLTHRFEVDGSVVTIATLGATNDPESTRCELDGVEAVLADSDRRIGVIMSRWDRPLRSMEFVGFVDPAEFDHLLLAGPFYRAMRRNLSRTGWDLSRVHALRWFDLRSTASLMRRLTRFGYGCPRITVVTLANVDPPVAERFLELLESQLLDDVPSFTGDEVSARGPSIVRRLRQMERTPSADTR